MRIKDCVEVFTQTLKTHAKNIGLNTKITETDKETILVNIIFDFMQYCDSHRIVYDNIFEKAETFLFNSRSEQAEEDKKNALVWLRNNEDVATLPCGCKLVILDCDPAFVVCEKHKEIYREG
jgi:hypothetical protein